MKRWLIILFIVGGGAALALGARWWWTARKPEAPAYRTATVERGAVVQLVRATGIVQPIKLVEVGTQVNGPVKKLFVDYNDRVKEGDLVAQIDPTVYEARLAQDQANVHQSQASVEQAQAKLIQAEKELVRSQELTRRDMLPQAELEAAVANRDTLAAQVRVAQAAVAQSQASLRLSQANLGYTTLRSPVDGIVIARNVSEGQTVVASMTAQVLFRIATDLRRIQVEASIPEADIGRIRVGQPVTFTVDAYEQEFTGAVAQIRLAAATAQNVVTYPVVVLADNPAERLFPGMTANIACEVAHRDDVLKVPNAALRFKPEGTNGAAARRTGRGAAAGSGTATRPAGHTVWTPGKDPDQGPRPVRVKLGASDGTFTEILEPTPLTAGQPVITGLADANTASSEVVNPFAPRMPGARRATR